MKKQEFLRELTRHLRKMSKEEREDIIADFEEYFFAALKENDEQTVCERLGDPKKIAREYYFQIAIEEANQKKSFKSMSRAFAASAGLGLANFFYVVCIVITGYIIISALYITACSIGLSGIAALVVSIAAGFGFGAWVWFSMFLCAIALVAIGVLLFIGVLQLAKLFRKANMKFLNMTRKGIKGRYENE